MHVPQGLLLILLKLLNYKDKKLASTIRLTCQGIQGLGREEGGLYRIPLKMVLALELACKAQTCSDTVGCHSLKMSYNRLKLLHLQTKQYRKICVKVSSILTKNHKPHHSHTLKIIHTRILFSSFSYTHA